MKWIRLDEAHLKTGIDNKDYVEQDWWDFKKGNKVKSIYSTYNDVVGVVVSASKSGIIKVDWGEGKIREERPSSLIKLPSTRGKKEPFSVGDIVNYDASNNQWMHFKDGEEPIIKDCRIVGKGIGDEWKLKVPGRDGFIVTMASQLELVTPFNG